MIRYHGEFVNQKGDTISVAISITTGEAREIVIDGTGSDVLWTDDPVDITAEINDTFDHLLHHSATIRLQARSFQEHLFARDFRAGRVTIGRGGECLFAGFLEPQTYSQPYNEVWDDIEVNCIDAISALQYVNYANIGRLGYDSYSLVKSNAQVRTFGSILTEIFTGMTEGFEQSHVWYDGSRSIDSTSGHHFDIFDQVSVSELLFLGEEEDDVWTQDKVVGEILKYFNLHIVQMGTDFYVFSWHTLTHGSTVTWKDLLSSSTKTTTSADKTITNAIVEDTNTQISIGEVYNQLLLTCDVTAMENVIESPLDDDQLTYAYTARQKYMTELSSDGEGESARSAFYNMTHDQGTDYDAGTYTDWYLQVMKHASWRFPMNGSGDLISTLCSSGHNQEALPNWLSRNIGAAILSMGNVVTETHHDDDSLVSKVSMDNFLVISVNGNEDDTASGSRPNDTQIAAIAPVAVYEGNVSGGTFSPADSKTNNYIVISGKIVLNPIMEMSNNYKWLSDHPNWLIPLSPEYVQVKTVYSRSAGDNKRYYTREYWKAYNPTDVESMDTTENARDNGFCPFTDKGPKQYEYSWSGEGSSSDTISKAAVLSCMLIIGDKCVVEEYPASVDRPDGAIERFVWKTYKERSQCSSDREYLAQSFTIGFNPKIGDFIIGQEYDIQNNIDYHMGLDAEGTAIRIKQSDAVSGQVKFKILGPCDTSWDDISRKHPTLFRSTSWTTETVPLLAHISNIVLKSFEVKVYSDNGLLNSGTNSDLVYMSDEKADFKNKKDDLEFAITSALTTQERQELNFSDGVNISTPVYQSIGLTQIYDHDTQQSAKPEKLYIDAYYREWSEPRVEMDQALQDKNQNVGFFNRYIHPAMPDKTFFVEGISRNLEEGSAKLKLKEVYD